MLRRAAYLFCAIPFFLLAQAPSGARAAERRVIAIFDLRTKGISLAPETLSALTEYVGARLASSEVYAIVPQATLKHQVQQHQVDSYKDCYDEACQIEVGKE